jgi:cell division protein FtsW
MSYRLDITLLMTWLLILATGTVMVASATIVKADSLFYKHMLFLVLSFAGFLAALMLPISLWQQLSRIALLICIAVCALVLFVGESRLGAQRWIAIGGFSIQAGEAAKPLMLLYFAGYLTRFHDEVALDPMVMLRLLGTFALVAVLLLLEPDFGTVVVLALTVCALLFLAGVKLRHFLLVALLGTGLLGALAVLEPYRMARLVGFLDPWADPQATGYQLTQALIGFGRGEFFGIGLGESVQKLYYLPEAHTDFIFAVFAEELGALGALGLLGLFVALVARLLRIAQQAAAAGEIFASYLVYGITLLLGIQCLINVGVNIGVLPTKGLTLPFVSYGGNSLIICCTLLGMAFRADMETADG